MQQDVEGSMPALDVGTESAEGDLAARFGCGDGMHRGGLPFVSSAGDCQRESRRIGDSAELLERANGRVDTFLFAEMSHHADQNLVRRNSEIVSHLNP